MTVISKSALIKGERSKKRISQIQLSGDACTQSTLSRIEAERHNPKAGVLEELLGHLYLEDYYFTMPTSMDYEVEQRKQEIKRELHNENFSEAKRQLEEILRLETTWDDIDLQFIQAVKITLCLETEKPDKEMYGKILKTLHMSMPDYEPGKALDFVLTETETILLDSFIRYFEKSGETAKARRMAEEVFFCIEKRHQEFEIYLFGYLSALKRLIFLEIKEEDYKSSYQHCLQYVKYCRTYGMWAELLGITMERARCEMQFENLEKARETVVEAYFGLLAVGKEKEAEEVRKRAKEELGIGFKIKFSGENKEYGDECM